VVGAGHPTNTYQNPPRFSYPKELLKHRFMPNGSFSVNSRPLELEDVETGEVQVVTTEKDKGPAKEKEKQKKEKKKRKGDVEETPKKSKKIKMPA
jgi:hypothetical protein